MVLEELELASSESTWGTLVLPQNNLIHAHRCLVTTGSTTAYHGRPVYGNKLLIMRQL